MCHEEKACDETDLYVFRETKGDQKYTEGGEDMIEDIGEMIAYGIESGELIIEGIGDFPERSVRMPPRDAKNPRNILKVLYSEIFDDEKIIVKDEFVMNGIEVEKDSGQA
jgi:hypothetical protein